MPRRNSKALTDPGIERMARPEAGNRVERFDALAPGLCLRITDRGSKSWSVYYRLAGKNQRATIGTWPAVKVAEARKRAREIKEQAQEGKDPRAALAEAKAIARAEAEAEAASRKTFGAVAENYIKRECLRLKRGDEIESVIRRELMPHWEYRLISEIRRRNLVELTDALIDAGKPMAAYKLHEVTKRLFNWALDRDDIAASPFAVMKPPVPKEPRSRALKDGEIKTLWQVWEQTGYPFGDLQKLLLLTGCRRGELAGMRWGEVDLDKAEWLVPATRVKMKRDNLVPLSQLAVSILGALPRFREGDFVFSTTGGLRPVSGYSKAKARADELAADKGREDGFATVEPWRWHDLRRTCRTGLARLGVPEVVAERVLNHIPRGLARVYNVHEYEDEKRDGLERWARHVAALTTPPPANVVKLPTSA